MKQGAGEKGDSKSRQRVLLHVVKIEQGDLFIPYGQGGKVAACQRTKKSGPSPSLFLVAPPTLPAPKLI